MSLHVEIIPALTDNYIYVLHDDASGETVAVDPGDAAPVLAALQANNWQLTHIWNTHHHHDHTHGNQELKDATGCKVLGAKAEGGRIAGLDTALEDGENWQWAGYDISVIATPGHTRGALCFRVHGAELLFTGDTLFALGCGRLFEGTAPQMWKSLARLRELPPQSLIYCGHEYTLANAKFARTVDPDNRQLAERQEHVAALRRQGKPSLPVSLQDELATNPFLRPDDPAIRRQLGLQKADDWQVFGQLRALKDQYRG